MPMARLGVRHPHWPFGHHPDAIRTRSYPVEVAPGGEVLERHLVAETVPVSIEENYVVVDV